VLGDAFVYMTTRYDVLHGVRLVCDLGLRGWFALFLSVFLSGFLFVMAVYNIYSAMCLRR